jgi:hypothetical protein
MTINLVYLAASTVSFLRCLWITWMHDSFPQRICKHYFLTQVDCNSCMQILVTADIYPFSWNIYAEEGVLHVL